MSSQIQGQLPTSVGLSTLTWLAFVLENPCKVIRLPKTTSAESLLVGTSGQSQETGLTEHSQGKENRALSKGMLGPDPEAPTDCPLTPHVSLVLLHTSLVLQSHRLDREISCVLLLKENFKSLSIKTSSVYIMIQRNFISFSQYWIIIQEEPRSGNTEGIFAYSEGAQALV